VVRGHCGTLGSAISIHETWTTWTALLLITSPAPEEFAAQGLSA